MTPPLALDSIEITNFRAFQHLEIDHLAQVNLIVGKNNVGKSSLLEAIQLLIDHGSPRQIARILSERDEISQESTFKTRDGRSTEFNYEDLNDISNGVQGLFYGRPNLKTIPELVIRSKHSDSQHITVKYTYFITQSDVDGRKRNEPIEPSDTELLTEEARVGLTIRNDVNTRIVPLDQIFVRPISAPVDTSQYRFIPTQGLSRRNISQFWDSIQLTPMEEEVLQALRLLAPRIDRISFKETDRNRIPIVKLTDQLAPVPLRSLGDGVNRLFGIVLALVSNRQQLALLNQGSLLLIDEIDTGLHWTVQDQIWKVLFRLAQELNVQIVATTHSWDCIEGFSEALQSDEMFDGQLISLRKSRKPEDDSIHPVYYDRREIAIATKERIEVR